MRSYYWIWLLALALAWIGAFLSLQPTAPWRIASCAGFFALFFLAPLSRNRPGLLAGILSGTAILGLIALWPERAVPPNPYVLLIFSLLAGKAIYRLPLLHALAVGVILSIGTLLPAIAGFPSFPLLFLLLYIVILAIALVLFKKTWESKSETAERNEALLHEYRTLKRRLMAEEAFARQEERTQIARDIHDSVGHKLTTLLLQLEVFRMNADSTMEGSLLDLKKLAKESLEETRSAVKTMKQHEVSGLSAIVNLIRKLEAESFMRIQFSVKHGALSAPLGNEQVMAIYRVVQEALTNSMRHAKAREAEILFEAPGGRVFRFEISNPSSQDVSFREGFGLATMRERMEQVGGNLEILQYNQRFVVRGTLLMAKAQR